MSYFRQFVVICLSLFAFVGISANAQMVPRAGQDYTVLDRPQPATPGNKVEVLEFFGYFCPACNAFEPEFERWLKTKADRIVIKRVHTDLHELVTQQKLYFTLEAMGKSEELASRVFAAYHVDRNRLSTDAEVMQLVDKLPIDKKKFMEIYNDSFTVKTKLARVPQLQSAFHTNGVPMVAIDGRFVVSPFDVAAKNRALPGAVHPGIQVLDYLVDQVYKEKNAVMAPAKAKNAEATTPAKKKK